ncbi:MAG: hypothetical protein WAV05_11255, partial [Anaerolineales bacterium]
MEQPHLTLGFGWKPGGFSRVAPPSKRCSVILVGKEVWYALQRLNRGPFWWNTRFQVTPQLYQQPACKRHNTNPAQATAALSKA